MGIRPVDCWNRQPLSGKKKKYQGEVNMVAWLTLATIRTANSRQSRPQHVYKRAITAISLGQGSSSVIEAEQLSRHIKSGVGGSNGGSGKEYKRGRDTLQ